LCIYRKRGEKQSDKIRTGCNWIVGAFSRKIPHCTPLVKYHFNLQMAFGRSQPTRKIQT
jgi:hypothetical protein